MKKYYYFWFVNSKNPTLQKFHKDYAFSGWYGTLQSAYGWGKNLLNVNKDESKIDFMAANGKKIYSAYRWFDNNGNLLGEIPQDCINDCTHASDCTQDVHYWLKELSFSVPADMARKYLQDFGAWEDLDTCSQDLLNERVLWIACGDLKESGEWFGLNN